MEALDLSIGSVIGMSAMISATLMCNGAHPVVAVLVAFVACMAIGVVNGVLVGMFKLPPFIGTLGTMTIGRGIAQIVNGNYNTGDIGQGLPKLSVIFSIMERRLESTMAYGSQS